MSPLNNTPKQVLLTFDVEGLPGKEDFITVEIISALYEILKLLEKHDLKAIFFVTGTAAEKIACYPQVLELLNNQEVGYHSSSHSVKPKIFEYTDIKDYEKAVEISRQRETSRIDAFTGSILGPGGIVYLRQIFPKKKIVSFRAPFLSWSPPHLEALRELGCRIDLSTSLSDVPVTHKDITFLPFPVVIDKLAFGFPVIFKKMLLGKRFIVFLAHPSHLVFKLAKSSSGQINNPFKPLQIKQSTPFVIQGRLFQLELLFLALRRLRKGGLIEVIDSVEKPEKSLKPKTLDVIDIQDVYGKSVWAPKNLFGYRPKFLLSHMRQFLET